MYHAKDKRDAYCVYTADLDARTAFASQHAWQHRIRQALEQDRFLLYAQPIQSLRNGVAHYELLLRMVGDDGSLILPSVFLGVAERSGQA